MEVESNTPGRPRGFGQFDAGLEGTRVRRNFLMATASVVRIVLARVTLRPPGLVLCIGLVCAWPVVLVLAPIGISSNNIASSEWFYELALIGSAVGAVLAAGAVEELRPILQRQSAGERLLGESSAVGASALVCAALAGLPAVAGAHPLLESLVGEAPGRVLPMIVAAVAASAVLGRLRLPRTLAPWLLACGLLLAPVVLPTPVRATSLLALAAAFGLGAWLLDHPPGSVR